MLKHITLNQKNLSIPVPLSTLEQVWNWLQDTFVDDAKVITRFVVAGQEFDIDHPNLLSLLRNTKVDATTKIEATIDSPTEIVLQVLESCQKLCSAVKGDLQFLAVKWFKLKKSENPAEFFSLKEDLGIVSELLEQLGYMMDVRHVECAPVKGAQIMMNTDMHALVKAYQEQDWKRCSSILLNRLDPQLKELISELDRLHIKLATVRDISGMQAAI